MRKRVSRTKLSVLHGAQHQHQPIVPSRFMSSDLKDAIDPAIKRNGFFGYLKDILIFILAENLFIFLTDSNAVLLVFVQISIKFTICLFVKYIAH